MRGKQLVFRKLTPVLHTFFSKVMIVIGICCSCLPSPATAQATHGGNFLEVSEIAVDLAAGSTVPALKCSELGQNSDFNFAVVSATEVESSDGLPGLCAVHGIIEPKVQFMLKLPDTWNRRIYMHGNGGYGGQSVTGSYGARLSGPALRQGFATVFTDTGHTRDDGHNASWAHNDLQKEIDYGFRAVHLTIETAKRLVADYYGKAASYSYFDGCSGGGRQGLVAAQRFPGDFNGIAAGAPFYDLAGIMMQYWNNQMALAETALSAAKVELLGNIIMERFDAVDGLRDGIISNPLEIDFDPARDLPADETGRNGFTGAEIKTLQRLYAGLELNGEQIAPGIVIGAELPGRRDAARTADKSMFLSSWNSRLYPDISGYNQQLDILIPWLRYMAFTKDDPEIDWQQLDPEQDWPRMTAMSAIFNADNPDLSGFRDSGGKLLMYHGWGDIGVSPIMTVQYYDKVMQTMGSEQTQSFFRTYMIPGMFHCYGGRNVDRFDTMTTLINWAEADVAPDRIIASRVENNHVTRTRPLCPYPKTARYRGSGDSNQADSFRCE